MKNIKPYSGDTFTFHKNIVNKSLNNGDVKNNVIKNETILALRYSDYKEKYDDNNLFSINPYGFDGENKANLLKLYSSKRKPLINLKVKLTTNEFNRRINTCPNCTIEKVASLDHYIPKEEFPEFSVNPLNLIPSCTTCNSKKNEYWKDDKRLLFLNLYSARIPQVLFLFVDIKSKTEFKFRLENKYNIDSNLFKIIKSHYVRLELLQRFEENSDEVISELDILISSFKKIINNDKKLFQFINEYYSEIETIDGVNNWKLVLVKSMINSSIYF